MIDQIPPPQKPLADRWPVAPTAPPATSNTERGIVGALLAAPGETLPPSLARIVEHSPESFDDLRYGTIARVIHRLRRQGEAAEVLVVRKQLLADGHEELGALALQLLSEPLPLPMADGDAERLWPAYQHRRAMLLIAESLDAVKSNP